jgi:hypothetical protein
MPAHAIPLKVLPGCQYRSLIALPMRRLANCSNGPLPIPVGRIALPSERIVFDIHRLHDRDCAAALAVQRTSVAPGCTVEQALAEGYSTGPCYFFGIL